MSIPQHTDIGEINEIIVKLKALYALVEDQVGCSNKCFQCCGSVSMLPIEADILGLDRCYTEMDEKTLKCQFLKDGKCSVYDKRPMICRLFNACDYGEFSCPISGSSQGMEPIVAERIHQLYISLTNLETPERIELFVDGVIESFERGTKNDMRNGWFEYDPLTGDKCTNFIGCKVHED